MLLSARIGLLPALGARPRYTWTGSTWALSGGRAFNTPTSTELLSNTSFDSNTTGWTGVNALLSSTSGGFAGNALLITNSASNGYAYASGTTTAGRWVILRYRHKSGTAAVATIRLASTSSGTDIAVRTGEASADWTEYAMSGRAVGANTFARLLCVGATGETVLFDNVSLQMPSRASLLATVAASASNLTASAKLFSLTTGTQAGPVACVDSASDPQNLLWAYHDGVGVTLDKCVAGTWSNVIPRVSVAFSSDAEPEIRRPSGNTFQLWYGGTQRGGDVTVSDASIISNTIYGMASTYAGNLFSRFTLGGILVPFGF